MELVLYGFLSSLLAGLAALIGSVPCLFLPRISEKSQSLAIGLSAGVMLAASFFSLLIPGFEVAEKISNFKVFGSLLVIAGFVVGGFFVWAVDAWFLKDPMEVIENHSEQEKQSFLRSMWLFITAITIHNFPEGMAVGVACGQEHLGSGLPLAIGIGIQNIPEGIIVAISSLALGYNKTKTFVICLFSSLATPLGGFFGTLLVQVSDYLMPIGLGFSAGAMLFVIIHKVIPELQKEGFHNHSTLGCFYGVIIMMGLDLIFA
tara:strand:- start:816 stop:1598 length:783 start_codon:yes stop_codon:yes gene_type:complete